MGRTSNPPHPGKTIREGVLPALGLSVTEAAEQLGVSRASFSRVINQWQDCYLAEHGPPARGLAKRTGARSERRIVVAGAIGI
jgi:transposase